MKLSKTYLAYVAGFVDGEGCVGTNLCWRTLSNGKRDKQIMTRVTVANTNLKILKEFKTKFKIGSVCKTPRNKDFPNSKQCYKWFVSCNQAVYILKLILPFLKLKKKQALLLLKIQKTKTFDSGHRVPKSILRKREKLRNAISILNKVGK